VTQRGAVSGPESRQMKKEAVALELELEMKIESGMTGEELYRRFQAGDNDVFEQLVSLYESELFGFLIGIVNDQHEAKHLMIESFAQLAVGGWKFAGKASLKTYLFTIAKNMAVRYMKMRSREKHISYEEIVEILVDKEKEEETLPDILEREENKQLLHKAMRSLKDEHRVVLILLYFEDMSYKSAGKAMNRSVKQISDLAYRAKAALKKKLENEGYEYT
jgi:RNA polymerase sigma-70 factor (ECF subfamily)